MIDCSVAVYRSGGGVNGVRRNSRHVEVVNTYICYVHYIRLASYCCFNMVASSISIDLVWLTAAVVVI